jgi:hypothetical protein
MAYIDSTYREQNGPDAGVARQQSAALTAYFDNAWIAWTPTIGASSGSPALGNGTFPAVYKRLGSVCMGRGKLTLGTTTNFGASGGLTITLPFPTPLAEFRLIGTWHAFHVSGSAMAMGMLRTLNSTTVCDFMYPAAWPTSTATEISGAAGTPWSWTATDFIDLQFCYEVGK